MAASSYASLFVASSPRAPAPCHKSQRRPPPCSALSSCRTYSPLLGSRSTRIHASMAHQMSPTCSFQILSSTGLRNGLWGRKDLAGTGDSAISKSKAKNIPAAGGVARAAANERIISLVIAVAVPFVLGVANAIGSNPNTPWYKDLKKPSFNPPNWLFGVTWGILYPVMGLASWLVWSERGFKKQAYPLAAYVVQLILNLLWPVIFFRGEKILLALWDISALLVSVAITIALFKPVNPLAAYLLIPYLAWVAFATFLNYKYLVLNGSSGDQIASQTP